MEVILHLNNTQLGTVGGGRPVAVPAVQAILATIKTFACTVKASSGWIKALQGG